MQIKQLKIGQRARRPTYDDKLYIERRLDGKLTYRGYDNTQLVRSNSTAYDKSDFILIKGTNDMQSYKETSHIVIDNKTATTMYLKSEEEALEYIEDSLEVNPRAKFKVFTPSLKVEPKRQSLTELITRL